MAKWAEIGSIREGKKCSECKTELEMNPDGEGRVCPNCGNTKGKLYIKIDNVEALENGDNLQIEKPHVKLENLAKFGAFDDKPEGELERRLEAIPYWLKYEISKPPKN